MTKKLIIFWDMTPNSFPFVGRLLGSFLSHETGDDIIFTNAGSHRTLRHYRPEDCNCSYINLRQLLESTFPTDQTSKF
jgi:hypothetical protein